MSYYDHQQPPSTVAGDYATQATAPTFSTGGMRSFESEFPVDGTDNRASVPPVDGGHIPGFSGLLHENYSGPVGNWSNDQVPDGNTNRALEPPTFSTGGMRSFESEFPVDGTDNRASVQTVDGGHIPGFSGLLHENYSVVGNWSNDQVPDGNTNRALVPTVDDGHGQAPGRSGLVHDNNSGLGNWSNRDGSVYRALDPTYEGGYGPDVSGLVRENKSAASGSGLGVYYSQEQGGSLSGMGPRDTSKAGASGGNQKVDFTGISLGAKNFRLVVPTAYYTEKDDY